MSSDTNPLNENAKLKSLLADVEAIDSVEGFNVWRDSFLEIYTTYLDTDGSDKAEAAYGKLAKSSTGLNKIVKTLENLVETGKLSADIVSVKGRMGMSELKVKLSKMVEEIVTLMPATDKEIKTGGFSKWHMGAVLVREGFTAYAVMMNSRALMTQLRAQVLDEVADRQILDEIEYFGKKFDIFCGVMADLGLMAVCEKATEVLHEDLMNESRKAQASAKKIKKDRLSQSIRSEAVPEKPKKLDVSTFETVSPPEETQTESPSPVPSKPIPPEDPSESSYETIEEEVTVSSYETVEREDDSSYETVEEIEADSDYETDEEEVEYSDYETDTDSEEESGDKKKVSKKGSRSKSKKNDKSVAKKKGPGTPSKKKASGKTGEKKSGGAGARKGSKSGSKKGSASTEGVSDGSGSEDDGDDDEEEDENEEENNDEESESEDSDIPPPVKYGKCKPMPVTQPTANDEDVYKPTERMKWGRKDYYHNGGEKPTRKNLFSFRKKKDPEPEPTPEPPKEKKKRRVVKLKTVRTRRKLEKPPPKKVRVKKEKPLVKVRERRVRKEVHKRRVKKGTEESKPIPRNILIKPESSVPEKSKELASFSPPKTPKKMKIEETSSVTKTPKKSKELKSPKKKKKEKDLTSLSPMKTPKKKKIGETISEAKTPKKSKELKSPKKKKKDKDGPSSPEKKKKKSQDSKTPRTPKTPTEKVSVTL